MLRPWEIGPSRRERRLGLPPTNETPPGKKLAHPARHAAAVFADSASIDEIRGLREKGIVQGVTTNPTLLKKAGADSWAAADKIMREILELMAPHPVCLELTELAPSKMLEQARRLADFGDNVVIKVAIGGYEAVAPEADAFSGLTVIHELWKRDIKTLATLIFNTSQAYWAALAGATLICPFMGRLGDYLYANDQPERPPGNALFYADEQSAKATEHDRAENTAYVAADGSRKDAGTRLIGEIATVFANYGIETQVLAASLRNPAQVMECLVAGADIVTIPAAILHGVASHSLTSAGMKAFVADTRVFDR